MGEVTGDVCLSRGLLGGCAGVGLAVEDQVLLEDVLDCLADRLAALDSAMCRRCQHMRARMQELTSYQVRLTHKEHFNASHQSFMVVTAYPLVYE